MNNISEDESEIQVYRCMLCGTKYKEMPQNKFCKVCGSPLNSRQTKISYNKIENGILIKISDEAALKYNECRAILVSITTLLSRV